MPIILKALTSPTAIRIAWSAALWFTALNMIRPKRYRRPKTQKFQKAKEYCHEKYKSNSIRKRMEKAGLRVVK